MDIVRTPWNVFVKQDGKECFVINLNVVPVLMDIAVPLESVLVIQATQDLLVKIVFQIQIVNMEPASIILLNAFAMMVLRACFAQHQFARKVAILNMECACSLRSVGVNQDGQEILVQNV